MQKVALLCTESTSFQDSASCPSCLIGTTLHPHIDTSPTSFFLIKNVPCWPTSECSTSTAPSLTTPAHSTPPLSASSVSLSSLEWSRWHLRRSYLSWRWTAWHSTSTVRGINARHGLPLPLYWKCLMRLFQSYMSWQSLLDVLFCLLRQDPGV